jgi:hypothetical protein
MKRKKNMRTRNLKLMKLGLFLLACCMGNVYHAYAQSKPPAVNFPTSPEAALMRRFGDIPVSNYTGVADISIPLYNLKIDNNEIPIVLRYHSSGIKVEDQATWVGLGFITWWCYRTGGKG